MNVTDNLYTEDIKLKPMKCELNYLSKSDGSAILAQGDTVVLASVNGPLDINMKNQNVDKATLEVLFLCKGGKPSVSDRYKENVIRQTCEAALLGNIHPRTGITVTIQEMEDCGGLLACCLNTVCLALINSGLAMNYTYAAVMCCIDESGNIVVDPPRKDLETSQSIMTYVFDSREKSLITCITEGMCSEYAFKEALEKCRAASGVVFNFYRDIVKNYSSIIG